MLLSDLLRFVRIKARKWINPSYSLSVIKDIITFIYLKYQGIETSYGFVTLSGFPRIKKYPNSRIIIDSNVTIVSNPRENPTGICHPVTLSTHSPGALIHIKSGSGISGATICAAERIIIGNCVALGANVSIYDTDFHAILPEDRMYDNFNKTKKASVVIEDYAWIGAHSIILKGVIVGHSAVIGAGSVVTKSVPEGTLYAGNPAKFIKKVI